MPVVVDSSVAACWVMPDEFSEIANAALEMVSSDGMLVPSLFWYELRNVLLVNERRRRLEAAQIVAGLVRIGRIPSEVDNELTDENVFRLARQFTLTIYDAVYLDVALRTRSALATLDRQLARAAETVGIMLVVARQ